MIGPIGPIGRAQPARRASERRGDERRRAERRAALAEEAARNLPVPAGPVRDHEPKAAPVGPGAVTAQLMGQGGDKRGLRGGPPVLEGARSAYLEAEYSGPGDRRMRKGRITKTEV